MKKIKLFAGAFIALALLISSVALTAEAAPTWDTTGSYVVAFEYLGPTYPHDMILVQNGLGNLTGNGGNPAGGTHVYTWVIDSGTVVGNTINLSAHYTASADAVTPLTTMTMTGTIALNGSMSGTWADNYAGGSRAGAWTTTSGAAVDTSAALPGVLGAEDFGVVDYDTGLGILSGYTAGFGVADNTFAGATSVIVKLYSGPTEGDLLQTNTAILSKFNADITGTQFSSPFDVSGSFAYAADGYWTNVRQAQYGQSVAATRVVATVTLANGKVVTATNTNPTGNPADIFPEGNVDPVLSAITTPVTIPELSAFSFDANATDGNGDTLTFSLSGAPSGATINGANGVFNWTPSELQGPGDYTFTVIVSDGSLSDSQSVTIHVTEVAAGENVAPVLDAITTPVTIPELSAFSFDANASDANGDTLTFMMNGAPSGATINSSTGVFNWTPSEAQGPGDYTFGIRVTDGSLGDGQSITIHVTEVAGETPPTTPQIKEECKNGGWMNFTNPGFRNQGQCVSYFNHTIGAPGLTWNNSNSRIWGSSETTVGTQGSGGNNYNANSSLRRVLNPDLDGGQAVTGGNRGAFVGRAECYNGGWMNLTDPAFRGQGQCISYYIQNP